MQDGEGLSDFLTLRELLYADQDLLQVLDLPSEDPAIARSKDCIRRGDLRAARRLLDSVAEGGPDDIDLGWTLACLEYLEADTTAARRALRRVLTLADDSRAVLLTWKLLRDLGEETPPEEATRLFGVVVEVTQPLEPTHYSVVAGFADGQLRWLTQPGPGLIGENWTEVERQSARDLVKSAESVLSSAVPGRVASLPPPGKAHVHLLTAGGPHVARVDLDGPHRQEHPVADVLHNAWQIHVRTTWFVMMALHRCPPRERAKALFDAVVNRDYTRVENFLSLGASADEQVEGVPVLAIAASRQDLEMVRLLVSRGADVDARASNDDGWNELPIVSLPAANGAGGVLEALLTAGADPNAGDASSMSPLMAASFRGHAGNLRLLLSHGAEVEQSDESGYTALMFAAKAGQVDCVAALLAAGARVDARDLEGNVPLVFASQHGFREIVEQMLAAGADPTARNESGLSASQIALMNGHLEVADILERAGRYRDDGPAHID